MNIGKRLKAYREYHQLTQEDLATKARVNEKYYGRIERNESCPTVDKLEKICTALGIELSELFLYHTRHDGRVFWLDQRIANATVRGLQNDIDIHFNRNALLDGCDNCLWYNGYICSMSFDEFELCIYAVGNIKGTLYIAYQAVLEVNRNDISSELRKYVNDDIQLSAIIEYMGYDEGVLHEHEGNVFFVNESNWLIARLVNHMTGEIVQDDIILDSGSITDVLNSRDAFFDYIFGTENH